AIDSADNLFIGDTDNHRIQKVAATSGVITTFAGPGTPGILGDNGLAQLAQIGNPNGISVDNAGNVFIADGLTIRRVAAATSIITTVAGSGGSFSDGGPALNAFLFSPFGVTIDAAGNLLIAEYSNQRIRKVAAQTGIISTVAGGASLLENGSAGAATL